MSTNEHQHPDVSVCIANYNGVPYVRDCLASVYAQAGEFGIEVILHDDCSSDDSLALVRDEFPLVSILESTTNVGFCISNNRMVAVARGRYVLLLNNDAVLRSGALQQLLACADAGHQEDILGLPQYTLVDGRLMDRGYCTDIFLNPVPVMTPGQREVGVATGACLWVPRVLWDKIGGFPEWFESIAEDIYLCIAARLLGHRVIVLASPGFDHWVGKNLGGGKVVSRRLETTVRRRALSERNKTFVMLLCYPGWVLVWVLPIHAVLLMIEALFLLVTGSGRAKVGNIYAPLPMSLWKRRTVCMELRKKLKGMRRCSTVRFFAMTSWLPRKLTMLLRYGIPRLR